MLGGRKCVCMCVGGGGGAGVYCYWPRAGGEAFGNTWLYHFCTKMTENMT